MTNKPHRTTAGRLPSPLLKLPVMQFRRGSPRGGSSLGKFAFKGDRVDKARPFASELRIPIKDHKRVWTSHLIDLKNNLVNKLVQNSVIF